MPKSPVGLKDDRRIPADAPRASCFLERLWAWSSVKAPVIKRALKNSMKKGLGLLRAKLCLAGLGWAGLGWAGLGWAGLFHITTYSRGAIGCQGKDKFFCKSSV